MAILPEANRFERKNKRPLSSLMPADGMIATAEKWASARPGGHLCDQATSISRPYRRGMITAYGPTSADLGDARYTGRDAAVGVKAARDSARSLVGFHRERQQNVAGCCAELGIS